MDEVYASRHSEVVLNEIEMMTGGRRGDVERDIASPAGLLPWIAGGVGLARGMRGRRNLGQM